MLGADRCFRIAGGRRCAGWRHCSNECSSARARALVITTPLAAAAWVLEGSRAPLRNEGRAVAAQSRGEGELMRQPHFNAQSSGKVSTISPGTSGEELARAAATWRERRGMASAAFGCINCCASPRRSGDGFGCAALAAGGGAMSSLPICGEGCSGNGEALSRDRRRDSLETASFGISFGLSGAKHVVAKSRYTQVRNEARVTSLCLPPGPVTRRSAHGDTRA